MAEMTEITLPSGALLKIGDIPFAEAKGLYQACMEEARGIQIRGEDSMLELKKNFFCAGFASKKVEAALWKCLERCRYNNLKIEEKTFEPMEAREDYWKVCMEVGEAAVRPFAKSLWSAFEAALNLMANAPQSTSETTTS